MRGFFIELWLVAKSPPIRLITGISLAISVFIPFYLSLHVQHMGEPWSILLADAFKSPHVYNTVVIFHYYSNYLFGIVMIMIISQGFVTRSYKLSLMNGVKKIDLFKNSVLLTLLCSLVLTIIGLMISMIVEWYENGGNLSFSGFSWFGIYFFQTFVLLSYAVTLALLINVPGVAIVTYFIWFGFVERLLAQFMDFDLKLYPIFRFLPGKVVEDLTYMISDGGLVVRHMEHYEYKFVVSGLWLVISLAINLYIFKKADYVR